MTNPPDFTGYAIEREDRDAIATQSIVLTGDIVGTDARPTRDMESVLRRDDQGPVNSCAGFGGTGAIETGFWLKQGHNRQLNPMWLYKRAQEFDGISGDNGATINGIVTAAKRVGCLPEDYQDNGTKDAPYVPQYNAGFPNEPGTGRTPAQIAADFKTGYSIVLSNFRAVLDWLKLNNGGAVIGGSWKSSWMPGPDGIIRGWSSGGGGHARALVSWRTINGVEYITEMNSHYESWGADGFAYWNEYEFNRMCTDWQTVIVGLSDLAVPEQRTWGVS